MFPNREGSRVPNVTFRTRQDGEWVDVTTEQLFDGKRVIVFALPGAFTPTCSSSHLPRYNELAPVFFEHGIDAVLCLSVNDAFVMNAWAADQAASNIHFIPDGNGDFSRGMGMLVGKQNLGFGERSWRYSMVVNDGVIEKQFIEPDQPGDPFVVSDADTMLKHVAPQAQKPRRITMFSKPGCPHCQRAKALLQTHALNYEEIVLGRGGVSYSTLAAVSGALTAPQIFIDGECIGGADQLTEWLAQA